MNGNEFRKQLSLLFTDIQEAIEESETEFDIEVSEQQLKISQSQFGVVLKAHARPQVLEMNFKTPRKFEFFDGQWLCVDTETSLISVLGDVLCEINGEELAVYL